MRLAHDWRAAYAAHEMAPTLNWHDSTVENGTLEVYLRTEGDARISKQWVSTFEELARESGTVNVTVHGDHRVTIAGVVGDPARLKADLDALVASVDDRMAEVRGVHEAEAKLVADEAQQERERDEQLQQAFREDPPDPS
jgi:hypothetical protein